MQDRFIYPNAMLHASRTKFPMNHTHKTSMYHGALTPIDIIEVVPGDTFELKLASLIRMSQPIVPIMDNIEIHIAAYFVPLRLCWDKYEDFEGVNKDGAWISSLSQPSSVPVLYYNGENDLPVLPGDILEMLGLPVGVKLKDAGNNGPSVLPWRGYYRIWNEQYRNANVSAPLAIDYSSNNTIFVDVNFENLRTFNEYSPFTTGNALASPADADVCLGLMKVCKFADVFTKCLLAPQRGQSVEYIPDVQVPVLPDAYPNVLDDVNAAVRTKMYRYSGTSSKWVGVSNSSNVLIDSSGNLVSQVDEISGDTSNVIIGNYKAHLENVTATINDLRILFQLQKYLEKDARYGLKNLADKTLGHFGVRAPDGVLQMSQYLGEYNHRINVEQVLSTAGATDTSETKLGQPGANSVTAFKCDLGTFSFTERGYIYILAATRHQHTYGNGYLAYLLHKTLYDFYDPLFANIGEMAVKKILLGSYDISNEENFGYQEPFYEYRFIPDRVTGYLNPAATGALDYWTLADNFSAAMPLLNEAFIYENRDDISRCLVSSSNGPDFIADFYFMHTAVRPMPLFGIPGLVDHH